MMITIFTIYVKTTAIESGLVVGAPKSQEEAHDGCQ